MKRAVFIASVLLCAGSAAWSAPKATAAQTERGRAKIESLTHDPLATQKWKVGDGQSRTTVVYLHGLGGRPTDDGLSHRLLEQFAARGESVDMVAPWMRPVKMGENGKIVSAGVQTMSDQLARARAVIAEQPGTVVLVGHSFGGKAALQLAREFPDKVKAVVGLAPSVNMLYAHWKQVTGERGLPDAAKIDEELGAYEHTLREKLAAATDEHDQRNLASALQYNATMRDLAKWEPQLEADVKTPTLVLHGTDDQAVSIHYIRRFKEANPAVRLVEMAGLGHGLDKYDGDALDEKRTNAANAEIGRQVSDWISLHGARTGGAQ